jgi:hypothetical protein
MWMLGKRIGGRGSRMTLHALDDQHYRSEVTHFGKPLKSAAHAEEPAFVMEDRGYSTPCWIWQLGTSKAGYGVLSSKYGPRLAHRYTWELAHGPLDDGLDVHHRCEVPSCINPDHFQVLTRSEHAKVHHPPTPKPPRAPKRLYRKLTPDMVRFIRSYPGSLTDAARQLGVSLSAASLVRSGKRWANLV